MSSPFSIILRSTRLTIIFVGLFIFVTIASITMGDVDSIANKTSVSLTETTNKSKIVADRSFTELSATDKTVVFYSEVDPLQYESIEKEMVQFHNGSEPIDNYAGTGTYTSTTYIPNRVE